jgi:hypothetical protein
MRKKSSTAFLDEAMPPLATRRRPVQFALPSFLTDGDIFGDDNSTSAIQLTAR